MLRRLIVDKVNEVPIHFLFDMEALCHRLEDGIRMSFLITAELHETQQKERFLLGAYLSFQTGTDGCDRLPTIHIVGQIIGHTHVVVQIEIDICVADSEMAAQIIYEHFLGSYLIYLFLLTKQGKQANETG